MGEVSGEGSRPRPAPPKRPAGMAALLAEARVAAKLEEPVAPRRCGSPRASFLAAGVLAFIGAARFSSDFLTDRDPGWVEGWRDSPLRFFVRMPSDGSLLADLNVQWFKVLAIPCCVAGLYVVKRLLARDLRATQRLWQMPLYRRLFLGLFALMCLVMELEKSFHFLGLRMAGQLPGEQAWLNHLIHGFSLAGGWWWMGWLRFVAPEEMASRRAPAVAGAPSGHGGAARRG
ncbi:MAG: hypothetical protein FJ293_00975 [Planctomycetes bacterium]|nr:hypothetical protein [Planctomycetota bacterium]